MLARETAVEQKTRTFSAWSHVVGLLFGQLTHAIGLNDVCDALCVRPKLSLETGFASDATQISAATGDYSLAPSRSHCES
jgi:uncharacterized protein DUF4372